MSFCVPGITHCEKHMNPIGFGQVCEDCEKERKNMTNREWLLNKMQNMSDEEIAEILECRKIVEINCKDKECCDGCIANWLREEHKESITLSEAERIILENIDKEYKWICRDCDSDLYVQNEKNEVNYLKTFNHLFQFITWNDEEPYNIEELLKGE